MDGNFVALPSRRFHVEYVASGVTREWSGDRQLCVFNIDNGYQETIDAWANNVKAVLTTWPENTPCLMLHDFHKALGFNRYFRKRFETLFKHRPDLKRYVAVIVPDDPIAEIIRAVITQQRSPTQAATWEVFTTRVSALAWLGEHE
ncbi:MAG TPA: hypothetical protein VHD90_04635 [Phototrophicaceae bacterium]|nr:hypothetical protein [Phototrophicaceae bacterium]